MTVSDRDLRIIEECKTSDEPCIVFRGKDTLLLPLLAEYVRDAANSGAATEFLQAITERYEQVDMWQINNPDKVKVPDLRPGEATS